MNTVKQLQGARKLIEKGWTTNALGRTPEGFAVDFDDPGAIQFCLRGALMRAGGSWESAWDGVPAWDILGELARKTGAVDAISFNNNSLSSERVLGLIDLAIAEAQARAS